MASVLPRVHREEVRELYRSVQYRHTNQRNRNLPSRNTVKQHILPERRAWEAPLGSAPLSGTHRLEPLTADLSGETTIKHITAWKLIDFDCFL